MLLLTSLPLDVLNGALLPFVSRATVLPHLKSCCRFLHEHLDKSKTVSMQHGEYHVISPPGKIEWNFGPFVTKHVYEEGLLVRENIYDSAMILRVIKPCNPQGMWHGKREHFDEEGKLLTVCSYFQDGLNLRSEAIRDNGTKVITHWSHGNRNRIGSTKKEAFDATTGRLVEQVIRPFETHAVLQAFCPETGKLRARMWRCFNGGFTDCRRYDEHGQELENDPNCDPTHRTCVYETCPFRQCFVHFRRYMMHI